MTDAHEQTDADESPANDAAATDGAAPGADAEGSPDAGTPRSDGGTADERAADEAAAAGGSGLADDGVLGTVYWAALGVAGLVAVASLYGFYANATEAIRIFVTEDYVPLFLAGFNLAVLLGSGVAISLLVRELAGE